MVTVSADWMIGNSTQCVCMWCWKSVSEVTVMERDQNRLSWARWGGVWAVRCLFLDQQAVSLLLC